MPEKSKDADRDCETPDLTPEASDNKRSPVDVEEMPFLQAYEVMFCVASYMGLHILTQDRSESYRISRWRLIPAVLLCGLSATGSIVIYYIALFTDESYYDVIMFMPIMIGCSFCLYVYVTVLSTSSHKYRAYLEEVDNNNLTLKKNNFLPLFVLVIAGYSILYTVCIYVTTPLPRLIFYVLLVPIFMTAFIPSFLDMHMFSFVHLLKVSLCKLALRVRGIEHWSPGDVRKIAQEWLRLSLVVDVHNKMFHVELNIRLILFMVQAMTLIFSLVVLMPSVSCLRQSLVLLPTLLALVDCIVRLYCVCYSGNYLIQAHKDVMCGVRRAALRSREVRHESSDLRQRYHHLHNLLSRMEARPLALQVWGRENLSGRTFVQNIALVISYLVALLQLRPEREQEESYYNHQSFSAVLSCD